MRGRRRLLIPGGLLVGMLGGERGKGGAYLGWAEGGLGACEGCEGRDDEGACEEHGCWWLKGVVSVGILVYVA